MNGMLRLARKVLFWIGRDRFDRELAEEMRLHREEVEKQLQAEGMSREEAYYAASRQFGNTLLLKERSHEMVEFRFETILQDFRYTLRQLSKNPGFATTAIFVLALGLSASIAIFAFVDATLIKPLPYPNPGALVEVTERTSMIPRASLSYADYLDWKRLNTVFSSLDVYTGDGYLLRGSSGTEVVSAVRVSDGFFRTLGVAPALGRDFYSGEDLPAALKTVILSYGAWQKRFGASRNVIGQAISLSGTAYVIVGVLPQQFQFAPAGNAEFWTTLHASSGCELRRSCHNLEGVARLKGGVSLQAALANMKLVAEQLERQYPDSNRGQGALVRPFSELVVGDVRPMLLILLGGAALLLLIACLNVASLLLVRSESRKREIAVRGALGASPGRLIRQFVTEALVLVGVAALLATFLAGTAMHLLAKLIPPEMLAGMPYLEGLGLNSHVLIFSAAVSLLAATLFSLTPGLRLRLGKISDGLSEASRGFAGTVWRRFGSNLVVVELGMAVVLLVAAGLLGKSLYRLLHVNLGFEPDHLATVRIAAADASYSKDQQQVELERRLLNRILSVPGIEASAIGNPLPVSFNGNTTWIRFLDRPFHGEHNEVNQRDVSSGYFTTLRAKLLRGRYFTDAEDASKPGVAVINQTLAKQYFGSEDPVGKKIAHYDLEPKSTREIIGVVEDIKEGPLDSEMWPAVYYPFNQSPDSYFYLAARTSKDEQSMLPTIVAAIREVDPGLGVYGEMTMAKKINDSQSAYLHRSAAWLVGGFAAAALLLGVVGLYGVIAYSVSQRTREIGVRMALGAERRSVYQMILKEAGWLTFLGIALGLMGSLVAATFIRNLLFGTQVWDGSTLSGVAVTLAVSALLASYLPARRAASVNPVEALRTE